MSNNLYPHSTGDITLVPHTELHVDYKLYILSHITVPQPKLN